MPEMILLGWIHTIIAIVALIAGYYTLVVYKVITTEQITGQIYLICTLIAAVTALMIYQRGTFGPAHGLAVLKINGQVEVFLPAADVEDMLASSANSFLDGIEKRHETV